MLYKDTKVEEGKLDLECTATTLQRKIDDTLLMFNMNEAAKSMPMHLTMSRLTSNKDSLSELAELVSQGDRASLFECRTHSHHHHHHHHHKKHDDDDTDKQQCHSAVATRDGLRLHGSSVAHRRRQHHIDELVKSENLAFCRARALYDADYFAFVFDMCSLLEDTTNTAPQVSGNDNQTTGYFTFSHLHIWQDLIIKGPRKCSLHHCKWRRVLLLVLLLFFRL